MTRKADMTTDISALIERVRAATESTQSETLYEVIDYFVPFKTQREDWYTFEAFMSVGVHLDAAVALVERVLPGWVWTVSLGSEGKPTAFVFPKDGKITSMGSAPTPALALVLALLLAMEAQSHD